MTTEEKLKECSYCGTNTRQCNYCTLHPNINQINRTIIETNRREDPRIMIRDPNPENLARETLITHLAQRDNTIVDSLIPRESMGYPERSMNMLNNPLMNREPLMRDINLNGREGHLSREQMNMLYHPYRSNSLDRMKEQQPYNYRNYSDNMYYHQMEKEEYDIVNIPKVLVDDIKFSNLQMKDELTLLVDKIKNLEDSIRFERKQNMKLIDLYQKVYENN